MPSSPVPQQVSEELTRVVRRWRELPLGRAEASLPLVRGLLADLAAAPVPDLGPAVAMDQLTVLVYDACARRPAADPAGLAGRLAALRRAL